MNRCKQNRVTMMIEKCGKSRYKERQKKEVERERERERENFLIIFVNQHGRGKLYLQQIHSTNDDIINTLYNSAIHYNKKTLNKTAIVNIIYA